MKQIRNKWEVGMRLTFWPWKNQLAKPIYNKLLHFPWCVLCVKSALFMKKLESFEEEFFISVVF